MLTFRISTFVYTVTGFFVELALNRTILAAELTRAQGE